MADRDPGTVQTTRTKWRYEARQVVDLEVTGAPVLRKTYGGQAPYRPVRAVLVYEQDTPGGPWKFYAANIVGPKLRKDGSDSLTEATERWYSNELGANQGPEWLPAVVEEYQPL